MSAAISTFARRLRLFLFIPWLAAFLACPGFSGNAQQPLSSVEAQRKAILGIAPWRCYCDVCRGRTIAGQQIVRTASIGHVAR